MTRAVEREIISTKQQKIAEWASGAPQRVLLALAQHIDRRWMEEAYRRTRQDGAVGVDGVTAAGDEERLQETLSDRLERFKSRGAHQALEALWKGLMAIGGGWVIELDIQSYFDRPS